MTAPQRAAFEAAYTEGVSDEPLEIIRANECDDGFNTLARSRFRRLWNELQAAQAADAGREAANAEFQDINDALALNPSEWNYDSNMTPFYNDADGHSRGGNCDGTYCVYGDDFEIDGERYDGPVLTERCGKADAMFIAACKPRVIRALLDRACASDAGREQVALDSPVECTCSAKDMTFGRCCKLASNNALSEVEPIVNEWLRNRGTSMDGVAYGAALDLAAFVKSRIVINAELVEALEGVIRVADRATDEFDKARAALSRAKEQK